MNEKLDPKELKILADILALVLEDESGQSANALEAIKKRAKKNTVTGGALKNLFYSVANNPPKKESSSSRSRKSNNSSEDLIKARSQIAILTQDINRLDMLVRNLRMQNESLRSELLLTQQSRAEMQSLLYTTQANAPFRKILVILSFFCGLFIGIASTVTIHSFSSPSPPNNTIYLN